MGSNPMRVVRVKSECYPEYQLITGKVGNGQRTWATPLMLLGGCMKDKKCGECIWNTDGLCDMKGFLVDDDDSACRRYEEEANTNDGV